MPHRRSFRYLIACFSLVATLSASLKGEMVYTPYHFTTIASNGASGNVDGTAALAKFNNPAAVAIDGQGNLVVADTDNHTIRLVTPQGVVTTLAGSPGNPGSADGQGAAARFNQPTGIAVDRVGNFIVADYGNLTIRRVTPQGVVTTIAGTAGSFQYADGVGSAARFIGPMAVATDRAGNIYVADSIEYLNIHIQSYDTIRRITPDGIVSTIAGTFAAPYDPASPPAGERVPAAAWFDRQLVHGITLDSANNVYIATGNSIMKLIPDGFIATLKSNGTVFGATNIVTGITTGADGTIFFTDGGSIRKITSAGVATTITGSSGSTGNADGSSVDARFNGPRGLSIDADGNLLVADSGNGTIRKITPDGVVATTAGRAPGSADPDSTSFSQLLTNSVGLAVDAQGVLYFSTANSIIKRSPDGTIATLAGVAGQSASVDGTGADARFLSIRGFTADLNGDVYVIDQHAIRKITAAGAVTTLAGDPNNSGSNDGTGSGAHFNFPLYLTVDASGNIYVADRLNYTVRKVTPTGTVTTLAGLANVSAYSDGVGSSARFSTQMGAIACDRTTGDIFIIDAGKLRKVTSDGTVTTGHDFASLSLAMTADSSGNLIIAGSTYIEQISPSGVISLLAGTEDPATSATAARTDGTGAYAHFDNPNSVAVAMDGRIFVRQDSLDKTLSVGTANRAPVVGSPNPVTTPGNQSVSIKLPASDPDGDPLTFTITGTVGGTATVAGNVATFTPTPGATGSASLSFTSSDGYATSTTGTVQVTITPPVPMLVNISTRGQVGTGDNVLIAGFVLRGPATTPKNVLIRAAGPALAGQNVGNPLSHPLITLVQGGTVLATNQGWGTAGNAAAIAATGTAVGAFSFPSGSNDSALLTQLLPGVYSALVSSTDGNGISLVEVYDGEMANASAHPVNVSTRGLVGTGDNVLIAGIAVSGATPQKFLIRAIGPGLSSVSSLGGLLADPQFHLYQGPTVQKHVIGWANDAEMSAAVAQTGAFPLPSGSADAAAIVTLEPGNYTVIVSSQSGATGIALVEVYQLP